MNDKSLTFLYDPDKYLKSTLTFELIGSPLYVHVGLSTDCDLCVIVSFSSEVKGGMCLV